MFDCRLWCGVVEGISIVKARLRISMAKNMIDLQVNEPIRLFGKIVDCRV